MTAPGLLRVALAQIDPTVGDLAGNAVLIERAIAQARDGGAQLVVLPELALTGYPPEDLLLRSHFLAATGAALEEIAAGVHGIVALVGFPELDDDLYNSAAVLADGRVQATYRKVRLPNYGVFDEQRYFQSGPGGALIEVDGVLVGLTVCEDIWTPGTPESDEALAGAPLIVNLSASPYHAGKGVQRELMLAQRARDTLSVFAFSALVGGQDELIFDGHSVVVDHLGQTVARAAQFEDDLLFCDVDVGAAKAARLRDTRHRAAARELRSVVPVIARLHTGVPAPTAAAPARMAELLQTEAEIYGALVLGTRDYVRKNGFSHTVLGLSGGIDSTLVALVAVDALGPDAVTCVTMPSPYSSTGTRSDAHELADRLGATLLELPIGGTMGVYEEVLGDAFAGREPDLTEENLQARIRGNLLMALSNKFGWLVLTTGNKSEMSVGYSTLYGDSAGGFAVIKDVPKTLVYRLTEWRNGTGDGVPPVPESVITRPPSAELRPDQRDDDSLPPYDVLDAILAGYVEEDLGRDALIARGLDAATVDRVIRLVDLAEYKRRQQPPGIKITPKAFGRDRRMPITNRFRG